MTTLMRAIECVMDSNSKANRDATQSFNFLLRFPEVWNATLHALELGSATSFTKGAIIPQKPPLDDNPERWRDAAYSIRHTPRCYSPLPNRQPLANRVTSELRVRTKPPATRVLPHGREIDSAYLWSQK
jgi:hypothetical protein